MTAGEFARVAKFRLMRGGRVVWTGDELESMRRFSDDVNKVAKGQEFGVGIPYADVRQGDKIVSYAVKQVLKPLQLKL